MKSKPYLNFITARASLTLFFSLFLLQASAQHQATGQRNGMLILGSADMGTLIERVEIGYRLFASGLPFDYIVVSGGCAAHKSAICEATEMTNLLVQKGVPAEIILKEEKSKTTVQNYVYSRMLRKADGSKVIRPGDKLYVVSNHWHAIPVAARFTENDSVTAVYHIEGGILPKNTDKVNYTNIFDPNVSSDAFVAKAMWPMVGASYTVENKKKQHTTYHFLNDLVYVQGATIAADGKVDRVAQVLPAVPVGWAGKIDAAYYNSLDKKVYVFKGKQYARFSPEAKTLDAGYPKPLTDLVKSLPENWQSGYLDAAFFNPNTREIFLFKGEEYLQVAAKNNKIATGSPKKLSTLVSDWPFSWGSGDVDAADYNSKENKIYLFRGKEYLEISLDGTPKVAPGYPKNIELAWPEAFLGKK